MKAYTWFYKGKVIRESSFLILPHNFLEGTYLYWLDAGTFNEDARWWKVHHELYARIGNQAPGSLKAQILLMGGIP